MAGWDGNMLVILQPHVREQSGAAWHGKHMESVTA
ncbi:hypothetical protein FOVG_18822 [Fusarium oxysporum f. sp. pisi HDV247]|uniref:Uncharacterized protein n=1 Tax=Fusarium oxysporum f. sp. pisi HDV247 TaxID=1080344 RepID=W9NG41_FUSOX|nr:hypothetical protein FOVG_18822 [Fusarium oxysporum f. sp. pisi HDV247]